MIILIDISVYVLLSINCDFPKGFMMYYAANETNEKCSSFIIIFYPIQKKKDTS